MTEEIGSAPAGNPEGSAAPPGEDWRASLPDDIKAEASLASIKDVPSLAKSYVNAQKMIGAKRFTVPGEKSTPEEWGEFRKAIGVPESVDGYQIEMEGADPALLDGYRKAALEAGVPAGSAAKLAAWFGGASKAAQEAQAAENTKAVEEWRAALGNKAEEHIGAAKKAMNALGLKPEQVDKFDDMLKAMGADGMWGVDVLAKLATDYKIGVEGDLIEGRGADSANSPESAKAAIKALETSEEYIKAATDKFYPNRQAILDKRAKLYELAYPDGEGFTVVSRAS